MANDMPVMVEVWPLAADEAGIWLVSGGEAWCTNTPVQSDSDPHGDVELLLALRGAGPDTVLLHSTARGGTDLPRHSSSPTSPCSTPARCRVAGGREALPIDAELRGGQAEAAPTQRTARGADG
jgi:hypothetical protein